MQLHRKTCDEFEFNRHLQLAAEIKPVTWWVLFITILRSPDGASTSQAHFCWTLLWRRWESMICACAHWLVSHIQFTAKFVLPPVSSPRHETKTFTLNPQTNAMLSPICSLKLDKNSAKTRTKQAPQHVLCNNKSDWKLLEILIIADKFVNCQIFAASQIMWNVPFLLQNTHTHIRSFHLHNLQIHKFFYDTNTVQRIPISRQDEWLWHTVQTHRCCTIHAPARVANNLMIVILSLSCLGRRPNVRQNYSLYVSSICALWLNIN